MCVSEDEFLTIQTAGDIEYEIINVGFEQVKHARLAIGGFLEQIRGVVSQASADTGIVEENGRWAEMASKKIVYYSAHDSTIGAVLGAFNLTQWRWPPYASNILIEMWKPEDNSEHFVRFIYNGELVHLPFAESTECSLSKFIQYISILIPENLLAECHATMASKHHSPRVDDEDSMINGDYPHYSMSHVIKELTKEQRPTQSSATNSVRDETYNMN